MEGGGREVRRKRREITTLYCVLYASCCASVCVLMYVSNTVFNRYVLHVNRFTMCVYVSNTVFLLPSSPYSSLLPSSLSSH